MVIVSCNRSSDTTTETISLETQNSYDDLAIKKFMDDNYFDSKGNIKAFSATDTSDDNYPKLSSYNPITLASGVVYIMRAGAQPNPGKAIGATDIIRLMHNMQNFVATKTDNIVTYGTISTVSNTIIQSGVPIVDPFFYYAKSTQIPSGKTSSYLEMEGFKEALQLFKSCEIDDSANYNLQGVIFVPSRSAYARDPNIFDSSTFKFNDRSFIFNFQVYKTTTR